MTSTFNQDPFQAFVVPRQTYGSSVYIPGERDALNGSGTRPQHNPLLRALIAAPVILLILILIPPFLLFVIDGCPLSYTQLTRLREEWRREHATHNRLRHEWQIELDEHNRLEEERARREKEERQKMNMFWGEVEKHQCTTYATREYTALLQNLPADYAYRVEACKEIPFEIHGVSYFPTQCEDKGPGIVIGRWEVNQHEADCVPFWNWYKDKGCTSVGSGKRCIEQYLEYLPRGADWGEFCSTTPASFLGMHFTGAQICFQHDLGTYGHWEIDDSEC